MASVHIWLELLSYVKAAVEAVTLGQDLREQYNKHRIERDTMAEAARVSRVFSTYSEAEVQAILDRFKACQDRFVAEGHGAARRQCMCNVFRDVVEGNGGQLPRIGDWKRLYEQL